MAANVPMFPFNVQVATKSTTTSVNPGVSVSTNMPWTTPSGGSQFVGVSSNVPSNASTSAPTNNPTGNQINTASWTSPQINPGSGPTNTWSGYSVTTVWTGPQQSNTSGIYTPQTNLGSSGQMPLSGASPQVSVIGSSSSGNTIWTGVVPQQGNARFIMEDDIAPQQQTAVSKNATVGQLLNFTKSSGTSSGINFDSKTVLKQICGVGNVKGNLDFFSGICSLSPRDDDSLSEDDSDDEDDEDDEYKTYDENDEYKKNDSIYTSSSNPVQHQPVQQNDFQSIPIIKSEDDVLPQEAGETAEEYAERKKLYDLITKTKYSGHAYIYSRTMAWRSRPGTHYPAEVLNTLDIVEKAIANLSCKEPEEVPDKGKEEETPQVA